ncbi:DUF3019 domain-containing protein [Thalassotalea ponticola]|uniref:DUF3019 domain-containing protein n=1 Tax=Thalassotalea ponticola TaxID=1523392 RepID=UPI0025B595CF|nr:DUF3019 domain-containing protein [Thalassotalea ponticola]MDN3651840.1 DUF3019 domain-containing protein [Thalassotalea ponticola]
MRFTPLSKHLLTIITYCAPTFMAMAQQALSTSSNLAEVHITPQVCIRDQLSESCQVELDAELKFTTPMNICLLIEALNIKQCFVHVKQVKFQQLLSIDENTTITIVNSDNNDLVYSKTLAIAEFKPANQRPRRNLGWIL